MANERNIDISNTSRIKYFFILILRLYIDPELLMYPGSGKKVCVVVVVEVVGGGGGV